MRRTNLSNLSAEVVNHVIERYGLSQSQIAGILGVDRSYISRACKAERELSVSQLAQLADYLGIEFGILLLNASPPRKPHSDPKVEKILDLCEECLRGFDPVRKMARELESKGRSTKQASKV